MGQVLRGAAPSKEICQQGSGNTDHAQARNTRCHKHDLNPLHSGVPLRMPPRSEDVEIRKGHWLTPQRFRP
jgi:hypothetical protein